MSGPSCCSTSFDFAAAPWSCSRSKLPTLGMSLSMTYLRSAMGSSDKRRSQERLSYNAFGQCAMRAPHSWAVYRLRRTPAQLIGIVHDQPDAQAAINRAIVEFKV